MPSFQEFAQKRAEQRQAAAEQKNQLMSDTMDRSAQAAGNQAQQPPPLYTQGGGSGVRRAPQAAPVSAGGSSVNSSGRVVAGGSPPLWYTQMQSAQQQTTVPQNQSWKAITPEDESFWKWATQEQNKANPGTHASAGEDFFRNLIEGTEVSGSPGKQWAKSGNMWGMQDIDKNAPIQPPPLPQDLPSWQGRYNPTNYTQWQGPNQSEFEQGAGDLLAYMLQNPESMSAENVHQLKQIQNDLATQISQNNQQSLLGDLSARGMSGGGLQTGLTNQNNQQLMSSILGSHRDIDLAKMERDYNDRMGVIGAAGDFMNSQLGRASENYANQLKGQTLNDQSRQFAAQQGAAQSGFEQAQFGDMRDYLMSLYNTQNANREAQLGRDFTGGQNQLNRDLQQRLADAGIGLDYSRLNWDKEQFAKTFPLQQAQVLGGLGLDAARLNLDRSKFASDDDFRRTQSALDWLLGR